MEPWRGRLTKYRHRVLGLLSLLSVITYLDRVCISIAGPRLQQELQISPQGWGWVTGVFTLAYAIFEIPSGAMGDRLGPRRVLTRIVWWWSAFTSLTGAVSNYALLLVVRFCFGVGEAGAFPNIGVVISRWFPLKQRTRAWGVVLMGGQFGGALAPMLVVPIQAAYGWRATFYLFGVFGIVWGLTWYWWFRDSPAEMPRVSRAEIDEIGSATPPGHGLPLGVALSSGNLWAVMGMAATTTYTIAFFQSWLGTYLKARGFTETGLLFASLPFLVGAVANASGGFIGDVFVRKFGLKLGRRWIGVIGLGSAAVFLTIAILLENRLVSLVLLSLAYGGITLAQPTLLAISTDIGREHAGAVAGFLNMSAYLGGFVSSLAFGYLVGYFRNYTLPFVPNILLLVAAALFMFRIDASKPLVVETEVAVAMA
jgi:MFS transporter, ACS family, glucarate transporter